MSEAKSEKKKRTSSLHLIRRFLPYYKPYRGTLVLDLFCALLTTVCEMVLPLLVRKITSVASTDPAELTVSLILQCAGLYLVLKIMDVVANYYMTAVGHIMGTKIETDMRRDFFGHLQKLSFTFFDNTKVGSLMSRISSDLFDITEFAHHCPEEFLIAGVKILTSFIILFHIHAGYTLILFSVLPIMVVVLAFFRRRLKNGFRMSRKTVAELNSQVEDSLLGIHEVKAFSNEHMEENKFGRGNHAFLDIKSKVYRLMGAFHSTTRLFDGVIYITTVVCGALFLRRGEILPADFIAYLLYVSALLTSVIRFVDFTEQFQQGMTGIERFTEIMDVEPDITDAPDAKVITGARGEITFENVTFSYEAKDRHVIENLNMTIHPGENFALVGPSGGGKTTLCSLIPRFYEVDSGTIRLDGEDITKITLESLRRQIGIVQQDVYLFSGSVRENIAYGKPEATEEELQRAADLAGATEFIDALPDGWDTYVGERGLKLSGGQKQRISIARVFLKDPPILILDEATSALDNESERLVQQSLERLAKGRTTITIAHRLTTIRHADRILVLTKEGIRESGSHEELMKKNGLYSQLYRMYTEES